MAGSALKNIHSEGSVHSGQRTLAELATASMKKVLSPAPITTSVYSPGGHTYVYTFLCIDVDLQIQLYLDI